LKVLITIASLQTQFVTLDLALKVTNRRVNALEFVQIPKILSIISWIDRELDEESREDFFRLKKVTDNKKELKLAA
jgi:V-type H+-transporting ATPase subunit D